VYWFTDRHFFLLALVLYGLSTLYAVFLWQKNFRRDDHVNYFLLLAGFALHTVAMFKRGLRLDALMPRLKFLGTFASPVLFAVGVFALMPSLDPPHGPQPDFSNWLTSLHAATILLAYGAFGLGAVAAVMFLMQQRALKTHKIRAVLSVFPSIQRLEMISTRLVLAGFILLTIGLEAGRHLARPEGVAYFSDSKVIWSALLWLAYLELQVAHKFFGRSSRNFAIGVVGAFVVLLLTFWITNLHSSLHHP
jgi:HemX protein